MLTPPSGTAGLLQLDVGRWWLPEDMGLLIAILCRWCTPAGTTPCCVVLTGGLSRKWVHLL